MVYRPPRKNPGSVPDRHRYIKSKWLFLLLVKQNIPGKVFPPKKDYPVKCGHGIILHNKKMKYGIEMECRSLETIRGGFPSFLNSLSLNVCTDEKQAICLKMAKRLQHLLGLR